MTRLSTRDAIAATPSSLAHAGDEFVSRSALALHIKGITKSFGPTTILSGIDLDVGSGEFLTLLGPSGCGKSTLLRLIAGFEVPDEGEIVVAGRPMRGIPPYERPLTMMFQGLALFPHMRVHDNVSFGLRARGMARQDYMPRVADALDLVGLSGMGMRRVQELSGGQRQRVALARCLVIQPALILLDEPLGALDLQLRHQLQSELKRIHQVSGCSFVLVTHDQEEAMALSDRVVVMRAGLIEQSGTPAEIYHKPRTSFVARFVGEMNLLQKRQLLDAGVEVPVPAADDAILAIRPELLTIQAASPGRAVAGVLQEPGFRIDGVVESVVQIAAMLRTTVRTKCGSLEVAGIATPDGSEAGPGKNVALRCRLSDIHILSE